MSRTTLTSLRRANRTARMTTSRLRGVDRCVPVMASDRLEAMYCSSKSPGSMPRSAQSFRKKMCGNESSPAMPRITSPVRRRGSVTTWLTSTPSRASASRTNRPICSSPTRVSMDERTPSRTRPAARFPDEPPRYLAKLCMSSRRPPTCCPYRSTAARPMQMTSRLLGRMAHRAAHRVFESRPHVLALIPGFDVVPRASAKLRDKPVDSIWLNALVQPRSPGPMLHRVQDFEPQPGSCSLRGRSGMPGRSR